MITATNIVKNVEILIFLQNYVIKYSNSDKGKATRHVHYENVIKPNRDKARKNKVNQQKKNS